MFIGCYVWCNCCNLSVLAGSAINTKENVSLHGFPATGKALCSNHCHLLLFSLICESKQYSIGIVLFCSGLMAQNLLFLRSCYVTKVSQDLFD